MSRQTSLTNYFKSTGCTPTFEREVTLCGNTKQMKRRSLSLVKRETPEKISKDPDIINLCSDLDDYPPLEVITPKKEKLDCSINSSSSTVSYTVSPSSLFVQQSPKASTSSGAKYFSPNKKRSAIKRSPVKRNLSKAFQIKVEEDNTFIEVCSGLDDKTVFLLKIIRDYLNDGSLKPLLDLNDQELLARCMNVVKPGMRVVCRLYWYQDGWYKREKIKQISCDEKHIDDPTMQLMLDSLVGNKLIDKNVCNGRSCMNLEEYMKILNLDEIKTICKELKIKIQSKNGGVEALKAYSKRTSNITNYFNGVNTNNKDRLLKILHDKTGVCYKLSEESRKTFYKLYCLMYLGMNYSIIREKRLELTLIYDKINRETYPVDKEMAVDNASVIFNCNSDFEMYIKAHQMYEKFLACDALDEKCNIVESVYQLYLDIDVELMISYIAIPVWLHRYTPAYIYVKILEAGVQDLKRVKSYDLALHILNALITQVAFRQHKKSEWYSEKALILRTLHRYDEAVQVFIEGFESDIPEETKDIMRPKAQKLAQQKNIEVTKQLREKLLQHATEHVILEANFDAKHMLKQPMELSYGKRGKSKFETRTSDGMLVQSAEEYCLTEYIASGDFTHGEHWEGRIVTTIFFLLFWNIIYTKPPAVCGIFLSHYQEHPLDLYTDRFYANRNTLIDNFLRNLENASENEMLESMSETWEARPECELSGINRSLGWEKVREVAWCLGPRRVAALCRRLARTYHYSHCGFPDLTLWNIHTKQIKFVEVKTDNDKPSMKQMQWMRYLREHNIDTEFCYVGVHTTRSKARTGVS